MDPITKKDTIVLRLMFISHTKKWDRLHNARFDGLTAVLLKIKACGMLHRAASNKTWIFTLNTLQVLNSEFDLLRCVFEMSHSKCSNCRPLPKNIATRTTQFIWAGNSRCWQESHFYTLLHLRHIMPQKQGVYFKLQNTRLFLQNKAVQTSTDTAAILTRSIHHVLLSNAGTVTCMPKPVFHQSIPQHCT
jgi:hypothetical protein